MLSARGSRPAWAWFDRLTPAAICVSAVAAASGLAAAAEAGSRVAVVAALAALGLPVAPAAEQPGGRGSGPRPLVVAGQARGVVALWLAARGLDPDAAIKLATAGRRGQRGTTPASADAFDRGFAWPASCETAPVVWSAQDLAAARALLGRPAGEVTSAVHRGWDRWRDPGTGTDALLAEMGLSPAGPFDQVVSRDPGSC